MSVEDVQRQIQEKLTKHDDLLKSLQDEVKSLKRLLDEQKGWIQNEMQKFDNKTLQKSKEDGDFVLQQKWIVRGEALIQAAHDSSSKDVRNLFDNVFGERYLRNFKSINEFPTDLKCASEELIGTISSFCEIHILYLYLLIEYLVKAKLTAKGGEYTATKRIMMDKLKTRLRNWKDYEKRKKLK